MLLTAPDIIYCIGKAQEITDYYKLNMLNGGATRRSVDYLLNICSEYLQKTVTTQLIPNQDANQKSIRGFCVSYGDSYKICLLAEMNLCWRRFVLCKELFHVVLDEDRYRTTEIYSHVEEVVATLFEPTSAGPGAVSEALAEIAAMEFLFPYADRIQIPGPILDYHAIAERYKVPQVLIETYLQAPFQKSLERFMVKK
jgi:Zn-dependent peptidase ImmA (M78 family)